MSENNPTRESLRQAWEQAKAKEDAERKSKNPSIAIEGQSASPIKSQPFIIIFKIFTVISLVIAGFCGLSLIIGSWKYLSTTENWEKQFLAEGLASRFYVFVISLLIYALFSFLISISNKK